MGVTKSDEFNARQNKTAELFKALGHPARVAIMEFLMKKQSCVCGDIVDELPLAQATVSQHLKALKEVGLIKGSIEGTSVCYCIDEKRLHELDKFITALLDYSSEKKCC
ncbi:MAG: metalloregulator ArsR/SmtB family transcription factor [Flavobacteriales bacterium]|nr:metalloregulator ArsR/SmtB family transcription factor [Flavobacteriales bacterium]